MSKFSLCMFYKSAAFSLFKIFRSIQNFEEEKNLFRLKFIDNNFMFNY